MIEAVGNAVYEHPVRVYYEDTDVGGIVYYANYLKFAERARTELLREHGFDQSVLIETDHVAFAVKECQATFNKPAHLDDALVVRTRITELSGASFRMTQEICREDDVLVAINVRLACLNTKTGTATRLPIAIKSCFSTGAAAPNSG